MTNFYLFFIASIMLNLTPGNDMVYVVSRTLSQGLKGGVLSALGIFIGGLVHILAAICGLSIIIAKSVFLFQIIKYAGAGYLIYLGLKALFSKRNPERTDGHLPNVRPLALLKQGIITNVLNPKVAIFFISFLPQFIDPASANLELQLLALGLWFDVQGTLVLITVALVISKSSNLLKKWPALWHWQEKVTGFILVALGLKLALSSTK